MFLSIPVKIKNLCFKPIPLPQPMDKILHVRVPRFLAIIIIVLISLPIIELVVSYFVFNIVFDILLPSVLAVMDYFPPYPERITYLGLIIVILASYAVILPIYYWFKKCSLRNLTRMALVILLVELIAFFWYRAWWTEYMYHNVFGDFEDFPIENRLDIISAYIKALFKTVAVTCLAFIPWLYLKNGQKHGS